MPAAGPLLKVSWPSAFAYGLARCVDLFGVWRPPDAVRSRRLVDSMCAAYGFDAAGSKLAARYRRLRIGLWLALVFDLTMLAAGMALILWGAPLAGRLTGQIVGSALALSGPVAGVAVVVSGHPDPELI